jgi:FkbH-like protein
MNAKSEDKKLVKCVAWDLDNTLWDGVLLEDAHVTLRESVAEIVKALDDRGILQSIASKNDYARAMAKLEELGLREYFLYPQINWNSKASSVKSIAASLNIGLDALAFIDDQPFERDEVNFSLPEVLCIDASDAHDLLERPEFTPRFITEDSRARRLMYLSDMERNQAEGEFLGPKEEFLATLGMRFDISPAREEDLKRAEELTVRTNQLNTTGYTYSYDQLHDFLESERHLLLVASLEDKYGSYGKIGLALVECGREVWVVKLLLMSCRVMSRGVGTIMINYLLGVARSRNVRLQAEFLSTDRNRMMYVTYKFANFKEVKRDGAFVLFENDLTRIQPFPEYVHVEVPAMASSLLAATSRQPHPSARLATES